MMEYDADLGPVSLRENDGVGCRPWVSFTERE